MGSPDMSVILVSPDGGLNLTRTLAALRRQAGRDRLELVFVVPSAADFAVPADDLGGFAGHQVVELGGPLTSTSVARAAGIRAASAPVVALAEDHSFPAPGWADALIARHREDWAAVGPAVENPNPRSPVGWANLLLEYGDWLAPAAGGERHHLPGHNSSYKRADLLAYGDALADRLEAESALQWDLRARGRKCYLDPAARTYHLNYERFGPSIGLRFWGGRLFAANRARHWSAGRRLAYALGSPLIPLVRLARVGPIAVRVVPPARRPAALAAAAVFLLVDGFGEFVGYAAGAGRAMAVLTADEFYRDRFLARPVSIPSLPAS